VDHNINEIISINCIKTGQNLSVKKHKLVGIKYSISMSDFIRDVI